MNTDFGRINPQKIFVNQLAKSALICVKKDGECKAISPSKTNVRMRLTNICVHLCKSVAKITPRASPLARD
ncbi:MAG: hypothetical protein EAZ21_16035 [Betaproteobacteria bacterium]|nr:MAG: hypothetical protein EAZ21_16035 [Betaproteobacteria bacterium]